MDASKSNELTVDEFVGTITKRNNQGALGNFKMPDNAWLYKNVKGGRKGMGGKKESWVVAIEKQSKKVPGVGTHSKVKEWGKVNGGTMNPKDRVTTLAELFKRKPSPGPSSYKSEAA